MIMDVSEYLHDFEHLVVNQIVSVLQTKRSNTLQFSITCWPEVMSMHKGSCVIAAIPVVNLLTHAFFKVYLEKVV